MAKQSLFDLKPDMFPQIYVYSDGRFPGLLKIGYTTRKDVEVRIKEQFPLLLPAKKKPYNLLLHETAMKDNGLFFTDKEVHKHLKREGVHNPDGEWFKCTVEDVRAALLAVKKGIKNEENRTQSFDMRPEQEHAVTMTANYFNQYKKMPHQLSPRFLWNAKMRFGKTFSTYELALKMGWTKILILTFKPAVESAWKDDLLSHIHFEGWQFIANDALKYEEVNLNKPFVCFGSFQDYLGKTTEGAIKVKNEWVHQMTWDCVVFDEYHFGAWRDSAKELFDDESEMDSISENDLKISHIPIKTNAYLYLSGTPFRALTSGDFIEEQIYNWTYADEQREKENWIGENNPYISLPQMVLMTYKLPDSIRDIALRGEFNEFDLNVFFKTAIQDDKTIFKYENEVQKWLDLIRGGLNETSIDNLHLGAEKPPMPFGDTSLRKILAHTIWFLPDVSSCYAMESLLKQPQNIFYQHYNIVVAAGVSAGIGIKAIEPVHKAMANPLETNTITLTCGKLTTGVTIKPWSGIFMLRNLKTPETYFQAAFRVQSPWVMDGEKGKIIMKTQCFVFDFAPDRALRQIASYCDKLNISDVSPEIKVQEFIRFLPILAYDGFAMEQIDAAGLLDMAMGRTTATLLAKGWNNALLVHVDPDTLKRLMDNEAAMRAILSIEGFRKAKEDFDLVINKSEAIKQMKQEKSERDLTKEEKKTLSEDEKIYKNKRDEIRDKLKTLATRIPLFMYLTDQREETLKDVITKLEPQLFRKVTGLNVIDFELLVSLGLFNSQLMNHAVYNFRRYEDASMSYAGLNKHEGENVGYYDKIVSEKEFRLKKPFL